MYSNREQARAGYFAIVTEMCSLKGLDKVRDEVLEDGRIVVDGVPLTLMLSVAGTYPRVIVFCDYGSLADKSSERQVRRLLELNLFTLGSQSGGAFALDPESQRIVFIRKFLLERLLATDLLEHVERMVALSKPWRRLFAMA
jgi:hypothetical protein